MGKKIFISHSSKHDRYAQRVRDRVYELLTQAGLEVLLDKRCLEPGDEWRAKLHHWLGICDGAVLLFSREGLQSDWVRKETTILTWRKAMGSSLRIVPAILGCVEPQDLDSFGLGPTQVSEIQITKLESKQETEENATLLARKIANRFAGLEPDTVDSALCKWIRTIGIYLKDVDPQNLDQAALLLGIQQEDWARFNERRDLLAHQLFHAGLSALFPVLRELAISMRQDYLERFLSCIVPTWVSEEAASKIVPITALAPKKRALAINSSQEMTGKYYVERATCCAGFTHIMASEVTGELAIDELFGRYNQAIRDVLYLTDESPEEIREMLSSQKEPIFVFIRKGNHSLKVVREVMARLRDQYPGLTFVLLCGEGFPEASELGLDAEALIHPELVRSKERAALREVNRILSLRLTSVTGQ